MPFASPPLTDTDVAGLARVYGAAVDIGAHEYIPASSSHPRKCLFDWAERQFLSLLWPSMAGTQFLHPYYYRYYGGTAVYTGMSMDDFHVYLLDAQGKMSDMGYMRDWIATSGCK